MQFKPYSLHTLLALMGVWGAMANAQQQVIDPNASPLEVSVGAVYVDHLNPTRIDSGSAQGVRVSPSGKLVAKSEGHWLQISYDADLQYFNVDDDLEGEDDSFVSYGAQLLSRTYLTSKWTVDAFAEYQGVQERYGTGLSRLRTNLVRADEFTQNRFGAGLAYGNDTSARSLSLFVDTRDLDYKSNNFYSDSFDQRQTSARLSLGFAVSSDTRIIAEVLAQDDDFDLESRPDSELISGLVGLSWKAGGKTSLRGLIGAYQRKTDGRGEADGVSWRFGAQYQASDRLSWLLESSRESVVDASEFASDSVRESWRGNAVYAIQEHIDVGVSIVSSKMEFEEAIQTRELDELSARLWSKYQWREHSYFELSLGHVDLEEPVTGVDYRQNEVGFHWSVSF